MTRVCEECGKYLPDGSHPNTRFHPQCYHERVRRVQSERNRKQKTCIQCGAAIPPRSCLKSYCPEHKRTSAAYRRQHIACIECGEPFPRGSKFQKYCPQHSKENIAIQAEKYHAIRNTRGQFAELATNNPGEAKRILADIIAEEGPQFQELLLNGLPRKLGLEESD